MTHLGAFRSNLRSGSADKAKKEEDKNVDLNRDTMGEIDNKSDSSSSSSSSSDDVLRGTDTDLFFLAYLLHVTTLWDASSQHHDASVTGLLVVYTRWKLLLLVYALPLS